MQHAFDSAPIDAAAARRAHSSWGWQDWILLVACLPAVLLALWVGITHHNWQRGTAAVACAVAAGERAERPIFLLGSVAGLALLLGVCLPGGSGPTLEFLSMREVWLLVLLPDLAWAASAAIVWLIFPLRRLLGRQTPEHSPMRSAFGAR